MEYGQNKRKSSLVFSMKMVVYATLGIILLGLVYLIKLGIMSW